MGLLMIRAFQLVKARLHCTRLLLVVSMLVMTRGSQAQLSSSFYESSCPTVASVVEQVVQQAVQTEARMAASLLRLHFHDCFVNGCDGSVLLDDTATVTGEKTAAPNLNSLRGFDVVDDIKSAVEAVCNATVSCADILALAANASVTLAGGPSWTVLLGRRDATSPATTSAVTQALPAPNTAMSTIISKFTAVGLTTQDTVVLSGAHTIGQARCTSFSLRLYNFSGTGSPDPSIDTTYLASLQSSCPEGGNANALNPLDVMSPTTFDNAYFTNLQSNKGLLLSDQELASDTSTSSLVSSFASSQSDFFTAFAKSMVSMGNISPLTGSQGEIRLSCRAVNA